MDDHRIEQTPDGHLLIVASVSATWTPGDGDQDPPSACAALLDTNGDLTVFAAAFALVDAAQDEAGLQLSLLRPPVEWAPTLSYLSKWNASNAMLKFATQLGIPEAKDEKAEFLPDYHTALIYSGGGCQFFAYPPWPGPDRAESVGCYIESKWLPEPSNTIAVAATTLGRELGF